MNAKTLSATALAMLCLASAAHAATVTNTMPVKITIQNACNVATTAPTTLDFGTQGVLAANVDSTATITVTCTTNAAYDIGLNAGLNGAGNVNARKMALAGKYVNYQLYSDTGHTTVWGNTIGTDAVHSIGTGDAQAFTVYGRVAAQTTPPAGVYTDSVTVTVTY